jgi:hypothetical protein
VLLDYGNAACLVNLGTARTLTSLPLPQRHPLRAVHFARKPADLSLRGSKVSWVGTGNANALWWQPGAVAVQTADMGFVTRFKPGSIWVPTGECYIGPGDMHSGHFVGCAAVVLHNGSLTAFAHCLSAAGPPHPGLLDVRSVASRLAPVIRSNPGTWQAYVAVAGSEDADVLRKSLAKLDVVVVQELMIGAEGHSVWFNARRRSLFLVPEDLAPSPASRPDRDLS